MRSSRSRASTTSGWARTSTASAWAQKGLDSAADFPALTDKLLERDFSQSDVLRILGDNFLRVFEFAQEK